VYLVRQSIKGSVIHPQIEKRKEHIKGRIIHPKIDPSRRKTDARERAKEDLQLPDGSHLLYDLPVVFLLRVCVCARAFLVCL
jgi:hypothetical protein